MPHESPHPNVTGRLGPPGKTLRWGLVAGLVGLTSLAVGATTSPWLVPPYLAAMAWLLAAPTARRTPGEATDSVAATIAPTLGVIESMPPGNAGTTAEPPTIAKPKTSRGRGRKPKPKAKAELPVEKTAATWVQVAPGKFVRVEMPVESVVETAPPHQAEEVAPTPEVTADVETEIVEPDGEPLKPQAAPAPIERHDAWRETMLITEDEPPAEPGFIAPPEPARLVAVGDPARPAQPRVGPARRARVRPNPRPKVRRGNGRVGAVPRVVLHRD